MEKYYVDVRKMEVVKESELNFTTLAPELYYEYGSSFYEGIVMEKWCVGEDKFIDFAYMYDDENIPLDREKHFQKFKVKLFNLVLFRVPPKIFEEEIKGK